MAFGRDAALDLSLRDVARDNVRVPAVLGERLRPALSPTRSRRRLESSVLYRRWPDPKRPRYGVNIR